MGKSKKENKELDLHILSINSFIDAIKDYLIFLVSLSSGFEIIATIIEGLASVEIINYSASLLTNTGLLIIFIFGLLPSVIGLLSIPYSKRFIVIKSYNSVFQIYKLVTRLSIIATIGFITGFSLIATSSVNDILTPLLFDQFYLISYPFKISILLTFAVIVILIYSLITILKIENKNEFPEIKEANKDEDL